MFNKIALVVASSLAVLVAAGGGSSCDTGTIQCCNTISTASNPNTASILAGLDILQGLGLDVPIGLTCNPLTVIGLGSGSVCEANPVCCSDIYDGGLVGVDCVPINVNL